MSRTPEDRRAYPQSPEKRKGRTVHDFGWAKGDRGLREMLNSLDRMGFQLVCVTAVGPELYKVFFRRPAR